MNQLIRYGIVGIASNLFIYFLYVLITYNDVEPKIAMTFLYFTGASISFFANKSFTFNYKSRVFGSVARYVLAHLFGYLLNFLILMVFADRLGYPHQLVQGIAIFTVAGFLFVCFKLFVFRERSWFCNEIGIRNICPAERHYDTKGAATEKSK